MCYDPTFSLFFSCGISIIDVFSLLAFRTVENGVHLGEWTVNREGLACFSRVSVAKAASPRKHSHACSYFPLACSYQAMCRILG